MAEQEGIVVVQEFYGPPRFTRDETELHVRKGLRIRGGVSIQHLDRGTDLSKFQLRESHLKSGHTLLLGELRINPNFIEIHGVYNTKGLTHTIHETPLRRIPLESTLPKDEIGSHRGVLLVHFTDRFIQEVGFAWYYLLASSLPESRRMLIPKGILSRRRYSVEEN